MTGERVWDAEQAAARIRDHEGQPGAMLPILHALQEEFGYIDEAAVPLLAHALNLSQAEVHGVISFYPDFRKQPAGRHHLRVCRAEACQSMDCNRLIRHLEERLGVKMGETTDDGLFTLEAVFCLGNCALSPALMLDGRPHGRVTPEAADFLLDDTRSRS